MAAKRRARKARKAKPRPRSQRKRKRSAKERAADAARSAAVKQRWAEARKYSERYGGRPRLDRRIQSVSISREGIEALEGLTRRKTRKDERRSERKRPTEFRVRLVSPDGTVRESDVLKVGGLVEPGKRAGLARAEFQRAIRDAVFGTLRAYAADYETVSVSPHGALIVDGEEWDVEIEHVEADRYSFSDYDDE